MSKKSEDTSCTSKPKPKRQLRPRFTQDQVYLLAAIIFPVTLFTQWFFNTDKSWLLRVIISLCCAYLPSYFDGSEFTVEGRYWGWFAQHRLWRSLYSYFPSKIHFEEPLDKTQQYIISSHPHGQYSIHHWNYVSNREFLQYFPNNNKRHLGASIVFKIPLFREWMLWGGIVDADATLANQVLERKYSMVALSGGLSEQVRTNIGEHFIYIRKRMGIFKLSLKYGAPIIPCYTFGENDVLTSIPIFQELRNYIADKWRTPIYFCYGRWFSFWPNKKPLNSYIGAPLSVKQMDNPTEKDILELQNRYIEAMVNLFDNHKAENNYPDAELKVL